MSDFDLPNAEVRRILVWVHWLQVGVLTLSGGLIAAVPRRRFGPPYDLLFQFPPGRYFLSAILLACAAVMAWALRNDRRTAMGRALRVAGINMLALALLLLLGSINGTTGVTGTVFACYVGLHLVLQSVLLNARQTS